MMAMAILKREQCHSLYFCFYFCICIIPGFEYYDFVAKSSHAISHTHTNTDKNILYTPPTHLCVILPKCVVSREDCVQKPDTNTAYSVLFPHPSLFPGFSVHQLFLLYFVCQRACSVLFEDCLGIIRSDLSAPGAGQSDTKKRDGEDEGNKIACSTPRGNG